MGTMTFLLPAGFQADALRELERACVAGGPDNMPWPTAVEVDPGRLILRRDTEESGNLVVPLDIDGVGRLMGSSATLMERPQPYHFQVELARGKVNQLRCQAADWRAGGLPIPQSVEEQIRAASHSFGQAILEPMPDPAEAHAQAALESGYRTGEDLTRVYMEQVFQVRHQREPRLNTGLGCRLTSLPSGEAAGLLLKASNSVCLPFIWSAVEPAEGDFQWQQADALLNWAESAGLEVAAGPLIDFSAAQLPEWLWMWERDLQGLGRLMANYVGTVIRRYRKRINRWQITTASNSSSVLSLAEEELHWLTMKLVQVARQTDSALELLVGVAQPWGEYLALEDRTNSPFLFADTLLRSDLNLGALDIELVMGVTPRGSYCRDLLEASRLLDLYALLGVPLRIVIGYPSSDEPDPKADPELRVAAGHWHGGFSAQTQAEWAAAFASLALCKPYVQAVYWAELSDATSHQFPCCGLLDAEGKPKPALEQLRILREQHLD